MDEATPTQLGKLLQRAVRENDRGGVLEALDQGADPNYQNPSTLTSPLHIACKLGHLKLALLLLQRGSDVNAQTKSGWIPMHFAVNTGILELVELLHSHGGRADIVNEWMKTPLDIAKERKNEEMLEVLKKRPGTFVPQARTPSTSAEGPPPVAAARVAPDSPRTKGLAGPRNKTTPNLQGSASATSLSQLGPSSSSGKLPPPPKSPRRTDTINAPTEAAPLPPLGGKPLPATPQEESATSPTKGRSFRNTGEWRERNPNQEIARLNKEVTQLRGDVDFLKAELSKVQRQLETMNGVDL